MQTVSSIEALRSQIRQWRQTGLSIAFVPTMGNLHDGHLQLVKSAQQLADKVVVSIFVNPTQFGPNEDFASYPRTEIEDQNRLTSCGTDLLFLPSVETIYPDNCQTQISVNALSRLHCGQHRPGHFDGVALVVCKLLNMVQPDFLVLGEKDFQQLAILKILVTDLNLPVTIQGVATVREADGLAMSSRNRYLSNEQRQIAPQLYHALKQAHNQILTGSANLETIGSQQIQRLQQAGFSVDYFSICRSNDLQLANNNDSDLVILAAARLGKTRLIDNVYFSRH